MTVFKLLVKVKGHNDIEPTGLRRRYQMIISEEVFEVGSPILVGEQTCENSGNAEKLFATFSLLVGFPILFSSNLDQLRIISKRAIREHAISSKLS